MAKPRVFLSSTFYDLRHVRADLERFIRELGYEPVLSERGQVPYGKQEALEQYCYREINMCDIVVSVVGGRFGSASAERPYSVSQLEIKTAHELHKQVYVFIEKAVLVEYRTWLRNESNPEFKAQYVDDIRIYSFLKEIHSYLANNVVADFDSVSEMIDFLRLQWAGLFQRFLQEESRREDYKISANLRATAEMLAKIVEYVTTERDETVKTLLVHNHPVFGQLADAAQIPIRIQFLDKDELDRLMAAFGYSEEITFDDDFVYSQTTPTEKREVKVLGEIFDGEGRLKPVEPGDWNRTFVTCTVEDVDDDIPF